MDPYNTPKLALKKLLDLFKTSPAGIKKLLKGEKINLTIRGRNHYITNVEARKLLRIPFKKKKIAFQIVKGGTGKTSCLYNIACAASALGARILCIDIDPQANLTAAFNINPLTVDVLIDIIDKKAKVQDTIVKVCDGIDLIPSRIENVAIDSKLMSNPSLNIQTLFSNILEDVEDNYDFIFIDCPPSLGHTVTAATLYTEIVCAPLNPDQFAESGFSILKKELTYLNKNHNKNIKYKAFVNKLSHNTLLSNKIVNTIMYEEFNEGNALATAVRFSQEVPNMTEQGLNAFSKCAPKAIQNDFYTITQELLEINLEESVRELKAQYIGNQAGKEKEEEYA